MINKFKGCVTRGNTLVLSISTEDEPYHYFNAENFPVEMLEKKKLTFKFLRTYIQETNVPCSCHEDYRFVVLMKTHDVPEWASAFTVIKIAWNGAKKATGSTNAASREAARDYAR